MVSKSRIKLLQSLRLKKYRQKYHLFVAEGEKCISTLLDHATYDLHQLYAISSWLDQHDTRVITEDVQNCTKEELKKLSSLKSSPSVIGVFRYKETEASMIQSCKSAIYLDDVQDPGNVGTIIRIADWYGVEAVIRSVDSADFYNPKVVQSSMGSIGHVKLITQDKIGIEDYLEGWSIVGAAMTSDKKSITSHPKQCLVIGNEGKGISSEVESILSATIHVPGSESKQADSLNAAISAGILAQHIWGGDL